MVSQVEQQLFDCIEGKRHFILDAGAGSGKTWTLVQTLNYVIKNKGKELQQNNQKIVCITYTNVAKNEIIERTDNNSLIIVNTIHDFLWDCIKFFQKELKVKLLEIILEKLSDSQNEQSKKKQKETKVYRDLTEKIEKYTNAIEILESQNKKIEYKNFTAYAKGVFSHDDLIIIAEKMFSSHPKLNKIITDYYPFMFVDEYQDTQKETIHILLKHLQGSSDFVLGFFGDKLQQIYDAGIGEIPEEFVLEKIKKEENYRSSIEVISLLNKVRTDIQQYQPEKNKQTGNIEFYYQPNINTLNSKKFIENNLIEKWRLEKSEDVKVLHLTHRLIAKENQYEEFYKRNEKYNDVIIKNKDNRGKTPYVDFLFDVEEIIEFYNENNIQALLKKIDHYSLNSFSSKQRLHKSIKDLIEIRNTGKVEHIIDFTINENIILKSDKMKNYDFEDAEKKQFYDELMQLDYSQFIRFYKVNQSSTPFSTQHGTKGDEFDNVLVVIDDKAWNKYSFNEYLSNINSNDSRIKRSKNLFYVVCSRARKNLAILFTSELSEDAQLQVKIWFGEIQKDNN
jgi:DNA helicase-2/ATP-dependent DNA helicase PcrA